MCAIAGIGYTLGMGPTTSSTKVAQTIKVPNVIGMQQADATKLLGDKGLKLIAADTKNNAKPKGEVIDCYPTVGSKVSTGDEIRVSISAGPNQVIVPVIIGTDLASAKQSIISSGFTVGNVTYGNSDTVQVGYIIRDNPPDGSNANKGDAIDLVVSTGPTIKMSTVPDVRNGSKDAAVTAINKAGLTYSINLIQTTDSTLDNMVKSQDLTPGSSVKQQSVVTIIVYQYVDNTVAVPDVTGQTQDDANTALTKLGFAVNSITTQTNDTTKDGTVALQDKNGKQPKGATVTITIYKYVADNSNTTNATNATNTAPTSGK